MSAPSLDASSGVGAGEQSPNATPDRETPTSRGAPPPVPGQSSYGDPDLLVPEVSEWGEAEPDVVALYVYATILRL
jgi:hypothetical protein